MSAPPIAADRMAALDLADMLAAAARQLRMLATPELPQVRAHSAPCMYVMVDTEPYRTQVAVPVRDVDSSHLVVLREENPHTGLWAMPEEPCRDHFWFVRLLVDVPAGTTSWDCNGGNGHVLARLDMPARCCAVTDARIVDLRQIEGAV